MASHQVIPAVSDLEIQEPLPPKLAIQGMSLTLGTRVVLDDLFFDVQPGQIVGLLGPNGSGKTSLMRCLTGMIRPDRGTVWLDGASVPAHSRDLRASMGVVFQEASLDNHLRAIENLELGGRLFGLSKLEARQRATELLNFVDLADRAQDLTKTFSGGMRRRLELARALIHKPDILLLDEPTSGLDPVAFERIWQRLMALRKAKELTILVSTHRADEAERCDRLVVMDRGHIVANEAPETLMKRVRGDIISLDVEDAERCVKAVEAELEMPARVVSKHGVELELNDAHQFVPRLVEAFPAGTFRSLSIRRPSLADAFFHLTGHSLDVEYGGLA